MWYFDTNILIYAITAIDETKMLQSQELINKCIKNNKFLISPVTLQELVFALAKLKINRQIIRDGFNSFLKYSHIKIDSKVIKDAFALCEKIDFLKNINDAIHLKFAEKYCEKLLTYDKHFKQFVPYSDLDIDIINSLS